MVRDWKETMLILAAAPKPEPFVYSIKFSGLLSHIWTIESLRWAFNNIVRLVTVGDTVKRDECHEEAT